MINGDTQIIAHVGYPTTTFKSPMIYNPWFEKREINAAIVPMGVRRDDVGRAFPEICRFTNFHGALITSAAQGRGDRPARRGLDAGKSGGLVQRGAPCGRRAAIGDMFDGEGFVRGVAHHGASLGGKRLLVVGSGGVGFGDRRLGGGSLGTAEIALYDVDAAAMQGLGDRLRQNYPDLKVSLGSKDPSRFDVVVNATPLGTYLGDPMPLDVSRLMPETYVAEVVMKHETTAFLAAAQAQGCRTQVGIDMLFEQIPAYLEFLGFPQATPEELREVAKVEY